MSVIIRLQNLPWSANALDIRQYFHGLSIPEGGVHIVGGELGDAFIAFSTDEDARQAFTRNSGKIKEVQISLMLSSRTEMQRVIEAARAQSYAAFLQPPPITSTLPPTASAVPMPAAVPAIAPKSRSRSRSYSRSRSRSKSKDRKERSRDKDRKRYRDRSRSRSRDRKSRSRRNRSRSRERTRSKDRRTSKDKRKRASPERTIQSFQKDRKQMPEVWASQPKPIEVPGQPMQTTQLIRAGLNAAALSQAQKAIGNIASSLPGHLNGFQANNFSTGRERQGRDSWPPATQNNFGANERKIDSVVEQQQVSFQNRFQRNNFQPRQESKDSCIAVEPIYGTYSDVRRLFKGMFISSSGIKFINDNNGRRTGIVYVQFGSHQNKEAALQMDGEEHSGHTLKISSLEDDVFREAVDRFVPNRSEGNGNENMYKFKNISKTFQASAQTPNYPEIKEFTALKVEDLPNYTKEQDILHMFSQHSLVALILTTKPKGGHVAYVKFSTSEVAKKAFEENSLHIVGGKQVTVNPCKDEEFNEINRQHDVDAAITSKPEPIKEKITTDCVSVSNLPANITKENIQDFFSDVGVVPARTHLMGNNQGFTGQAYCELKTTDDANSALKKSGAVLGEDVITVELIKRDEMMAILGNTEPVPDELVQQLPETTPPMVRPLMSGPPVAPPEIRMFNQSRLPFRPRNVFEPPRGHFAGGPRYHFDSRPRQFERCPRPFGGAPRQFDGRPRHYFEGRSRHHFEEKPQVEYEENFEGNPHEFEGNPRSRMGPREQQRSRLPILVDTDDAPEGCTIFMKNVPYKAGTDEILKFFEGFNHTRHVSRRYNPNNSPSDEAKIIFFDANEAARAVTELNKQRIWDRQIFLTRE
nr:unnamed protein product [Callosobruchus chinensis]